MPGEYYLRVNQHYPLKLLVLDRDSTEVDSNRLIADFVASNCIEGPDGAARHLGGQTAFDPARFFESEAPVPLSRSSMLQLIADLESCASRSSPH